MPLTPDWERAAVLPALAAGSISINLCDLAYRAQRPER